ncbi:hypothetical protein NC653_032718 [Populus alba x Populus x berolinensis]|uniref:Uncharacterized protein n=1 Tax=Populus alba x Populus x berolinensis TaxID=444605 RepID=A0AAD6LT79_9ROSI|nr:hypothetical protein NC653_032718 [Populus alba x Populus x berolinensis]
MGMDQVFILDYKNEFTEILREAWGVRLVTDLNIVFSGHDVGLFSRMILLAVNQHLPKVNGIIKTLKEEVSWKKTGIVPAKKTHATRKIKSAMIREVIILRKPIKIKLTNNNTANTEPCRDQTVDLK